MAAPTGGGCPCLARAAVGTCGMRVNGARMIGSTVFVACARRSVPMRLGVDGQPV